MRKIYTVVNPEHILWINSFSGLVALSWKKARPWGKHNWNLTILMWISKKYYQADAPCWHCFSQNIQATVKQTLLRVHINRLIIHCCEMGVCLGKLVWILIIKANRDLTCEAHTAAAVHFVCLMPFPFTGDKDIASLFGDGDESKGLMCSSLKCSMWVVYECVCFRGKRQLNIYYTVNQYVLSFQAE